MEGDQEFQKFKKELEDGFANLAKSVELRQDKFESEFAAKQLRTLYALITGLVLLLIAVAYLAYNNTASLSQIGAARAEFQKIESDLNGKSVQLSNAVVAFDAKECPSGWTSFADGRGRVVVGANLTNVRNVDKDNHALSERNLGASGGVEANILMRDQLPNGAFVTVFNNIEQSNVKLISIPNVLPGEINAIAHAGPKYPASPVTLQTTLNSGEQRSINNMPPFIVLTFCKQNGP